MKCDTLPDRIQTDDPAFVRDTHSKALLNTDRGALSRHRQQRDKSRRQQQDLERLARTQEQLQVQVNDLASKLNKILNILV